MILTIAHTAYMRLKSLPEKTFFLTRFMIILQFENVEYHPKSEQQDNLFKSNFHMLSAINNLAKVRLSIFFVYTYHIGFLTHKPYKYALHI